MKKTIICITLAGLMLLAGCDKAGGAKEPTTIDLNDYIEYQIEGYSTKASLSYTIKYEDIIEDFELEDVAASRLEKKITGTWSKMTYLSNGDEITFEWNVDADSIEEKYNVEFKADDLTVQVKDLDEMPEFDPFEYIEVSFSGMSGDGTVTVDISDACPLDDVRYTVDGSSYYLSNGDEVTIVASTYSNGDLEEYCEDNDYILVSDTATYTVEGLDRYVAAIEELTPEMLTELQTQASDSINAFYDLDDGESITGVNYIGLYFLKNKTDGSYYQNYVYLIYQVTFSTPAGDMTLYTYVRFEDIIYLADGSNEIYDILDTDMPSSWDSEVGIGEYSWGSYEYEHAGYADVGALYNDEIRPELEDYTITNNIPDEYLNAAPSEEPVDEAEASDEESDEEVVEETEEETVEEEG